MQELYFGSICSCVFSKLALHKDPDSVLIDDKTPFTFDGDFTAAADGAFKTRIPIGDTAMIYLCSKGEAAAFCRSTGCAPANLPAMPEGALCLFLCVNK